MATYDRDYPGSDLTIVQLLNALNRKLENTTRFRYELELVPPCFAAHLGLAFVQTSMLIKLGVIMNLTDDILKENCS